MQRSDRGRRILVRCSEVARRIQEGYLPILRDTPGFVAYYLVHTGNDAGLSITIFETQAQAEAFQHPEGKASRCNLVCSTNCRARPGRMR